MPPDLDPKRVGLLIPSSNTTIEVDFYRNVPASVTVHTARMFMEDTTVAGESRMLDEFALPAARDITTARPHVVVFGCTSAGALRGNDYDDRLCQEITRLSGVPTVSVIRSVREILQGASVRRLVVITPYVEELNTRIQASLEADGVEVMRIRGLGITENFMIATVPGAEIIRLAVETVGDLQPDALFVSCTNFPAVSCLTELRRRFPFPVFTSNQAALEKALQMVGVVPSTRSTSSV
jgi:maleate isomerase